MCAHKIRVCILATSILLLLSCITQAGQKMTSVKTPSRDVKIFFKLDPRITRGMYMGDRWGSPVTYTIAQPGKVATVEVKVEGVDALGKRSVLQSDWTPEDPKMISVTPVKGKKNQYQITIKQVGTTSVQVTAKGLNRKLSIKAEQKDNAMKVEIR